MRTTAQDLLNPAHPLHRPFRLICQQKGVEPTKRQARAFLAKYPKYREAQRV